MRALTVLWGIPRLAHSHAGPDRRRAWRPNDAFWRHTSHWSCDMNMRTAVLAAMLIAPPSGIALAQSSAAEHIARGDSAHAAMQTASALQHYEAAIRADSNNYEALWKASQEAVDLGEFNANRDEQTRLYNLSEQLARRAVAVKPEDAEGHFNLARAIGRNALRMGTRDRIKYAKVVRNEALA